MWGKNPAGSPVWMLLESCLACGEPALAVLPPAMAIKVSEVCVLHTIALDIGKQSFLAGRPPFYALFNKLTIPHAQICFLQAQPSVHTLGCASDIAHGEMLLSIHGAKGSAMSGSIVGALLHIRRRCVLTVAIKLIGLVTLLIKYHQESHALLRRSRYRELPS